MSGVSATPASRSRYTDFLTPTTEDEWRRVGHLLVNRRTGETKPAPTSDIEGAAPASMTAGGERERRASDYVDRFGTAVLSNLSAPVDLVGMLTDRVSSAPGLANLVPGGAGAAAALGTAVNAGRAGLAAAERVTDLPFTSESQERHRDRFRELSTDMSPVVDALVDTGVEGAGIVADPVAAGLAVAKLARTSSRLAPAVDAALGAVERRATPRADLTNKQLNDELWTLVRGGADKADPRVVELQAAIRERVASHEAAAPTTPTQPRQPVMPDVPPPDQLSSATQVPPTQPLTGIADAYTQAQRAERGLPKVEVPASQLRGGDEAVLAAGRKLVDDNIVDPRLLARHLADNPRALSGEEISVLLYDRTRLTNEYRTAIDEADMAFASGDEARGIAAKQRLVDIEDARNDNEIAGKRTGYEWSVSGNAMQQLMADDYSAAGVVQRARVYANGKPVEGARRVTLTSLAKELEQTRASLTALQESASQRAADAALAGMRKRAGREAAHAGRSAGRAATRERLDAEFGELSTRFRSSMGTPRAGLDPELATLMGKMAANRVHAGINSTAEVVDAVYMVARDHIEGLTVRQVRDAISGYGAQPKPAKSQLVGGLREAKREMYLISKLEDVKAGNALPGATRTRRPKPEALAQLEQQIKDSMKAQGISSSQHLDDAARLAAYKKRKAARITELEEQLRTGQYVKHQPQQSIPLDREALDMKTRERLLRAQVDDELEAVRRAHLTPSERLGEVVKQAAGAVRTNKSILDLSFPFRQGLGAIRYPKQFGQSLVDMHKYAVSEKAYQRMVSRVETDPDYLLMRRAGLDLSAIDGRIKPTAGEEHLIGSRVLEKIPVYGKLVRGSERAFSGMATQLRTDVFKHLVDMAELAGRNPRTDAKLSSDLARVVNTLTGRGDLGRFSKMGGELSTALWSPRLMASRLNMLDIVPRKTVMSADGSKVMQGNYYASLDPFARRQALESLAAVTAFVGTMGTLAVAAGFDVSVDPRNADFGKIKVGDTRIDFGGGLLQYVRLAAQQATGKAVSSTSGEVYDLDSGDYGKPTRLTVAQRFLEGKANPFTAALLNAMRGKTLTGEDVTWASQANTLLMPLPIETTIELANTNPAHVAPGMLASSYGVGVQAYEGRGERQSTDPVDMELERVGAPLHPGGVRLVDPTQGREVRLSKAEHGEYQLIADAKTREMLTALFADDSYASADDEMKRELVRHATGVAREYGRMKLWAKKYNWGNGAR
jgi:hypothetical protein